MRKFVSAALLVVMLFAFAACEEKTEPRNNDPVLYSASDAVQMQTISDENRVWQVETVEGSKIHIVRWIYICEDGKYEFTKKEKQYMDAELDANTEILMGDIFNKGDKSLAEYDKTTTLEFFLENATNTVDDKLLYFTADIEKGKIKKIELFWEYYFEA